jgi:hypothetical protein
MKLKSNKTDGFGFDGISAELQKEFCHISSRMKILTEFFKTKCNWWFSESWEMQLFILFIKEKVIQKLQESRGYFYFFQYLDC